MNPDVEPTFALPNILCCLCGASIESNPAAMCLNCLKTQVDITEGISKQLQVFWCRTCGRYQRPPWQMCQPESRELLSLLLSKVRGMQKDTRLVDVDFVYTEPHSKRLKIKITVQKEVFPGAILQQAFIVEYVVCNQQCPDCAQSYTEHVWEALVQVRQKVRHKRTFLFLEQQLLKHQVCKNMLGVKSITGGLDFYWKKESHAQAMVHFLRGVVPMKLTESRKLVSEDHTNNTQKFKYTFFVNIVPICRLDLVYMPLKAGKKFGGINEVQLCTKVTGSVHLLDVSSLRAVDVSAAVYWRNPCHTLMSSSQLTLFDVLDVIPTDETSGKFRLCEVVIARVSDYQQFTVMSHLGNILEAGHVVQGYDLTSNTFSSIVADDVNTETWPEVVLVKRMFAKKNRKRNRTFTLQTMEKEAADSKQPKKHELAQEERDMETFMQDLEEDPEYRHGLNLFKRKTESKRNTMDEGSDSEELDAAPEIAIEELLDDISNLTMDRP